MVSRPPRLHDKVVLVTGASSGLGRAISLVYASHGTKVIVCADLTPNPPPANPDAEAFKGDDDAGAFSTDEPTHDAINRVYGAGRAVYMPLDVTDAAQVKKVVAEVAAHAGRLDVVVNSAGISSGGEAAPMHLEDDAVWEKVMNVNVRGTYLVSKNAIVQMLTQPPDATGKRGWIINLSSVLGSGGFMGGFGPVLAPYTTSKGAVLNLTKHIAVSYADQGIHCNALQPGFTKSPMTRTMYGKDTKALNDLVMSKHPMDGWGTTEAVAKAAVFLASDDASWVTGIGLPVDGGYMAH